jgi:sulfur-carrier protein
MNRLAAAAASHFLQSEGEPVSSNKEMRQIIPARFAEIDRIFKETSPTTIFIPTPLRPYVGGHPQVEIEASTIAEALSGLTGSNPDLKSHLFTAEGKLRAFVNLYLNDEDVRYLPAKEATAVKSGDTLTIIPSIAGGN